MNDDFYDNDIEELVDGSSLDENQVIYNEPPQVRKRQEPKEKKNFESPKEKIGNKIDQAGAKVSKTGKSVKKTGKKLEKAGSGVEKTGKIAETAGKGIQATGKGIQSASNAAGAALSAIPYVGAPLGKIVQGAGNAVGKGTETAGKGAATAGKGAQRAGQKMKAAGKKTQEVGSKIEDKGNKISDRGKNLASDSLSSKLREAKNKSSIPLGNSLAKNNSSGAGKIKDKLKNAKEDIKAFFSTKLDGKSIKTKIKFYVIGFILILLFLAIFVMVTFSPILDVMQKIDSVVDNLTESSQKLSNAYIGFGLQSTKEAFYEEADYLNEEYDEQLDMPLIMATLFYNERQGYNTQYGIIPDAVDGVSGSKDGMISSITSYLKEKYDSVYETLDEDGKKYTIGKIYRLRMLAKNQMSSSFLGTAIPTSTEEVSLKDFLERSKDRISSDLYQLLETVPSTLTEIPQFLSKLHEITKVFDGDEVWSTTSFGNWSEPARAIGMVLKELVVTGVEVSSLRFDLTDMEFKVTINKYEQDLDNFKQYLHDYYIKTMPEFKISQSTKADPDKLEYEINKTINDIYLYAEEFEQIFGYYKNSAMSDSDTECVGNIDEDLLDKLKKLPVDSTSFNFEGADAYGISDGTQNNGVNLSQTSAGVKIGDNVYSVLGGKVVEVNKKSSCNTATKADCNPLGNYVKIKHENVRNNGASFTFTTLYSNLKEVKVKKGDSVKAGQVIGLVGKTGNATEPMVHFEMYDETGKEYLNPTNFFIPCESGGGSMCGKNVKEQVWSYFKSKGFSNESTAGIMGNIEQESSFIPDNIQGGGAGPAAGLFQFENITTKSGRWKNLYDYAKKKKTTWKDTTTQLNFMYEKDMDDQFKQYTGRTPYRYSNGTLAWWPTKVTVKTYKNVTDIKEATEIFERVFERASIPNMENRIVNAKKYYKQYKNFKCKSNKDMSSKKLSSITGSHDEKIKKLFDGKMPTSRAEIEKYIVSVEVPTTSKSGKKETKKVRIHKDLAQSLKTALQAAQDSGFIVYDIGGYNYRQVTNGTRLSDHSYGVAVDINYMENCYKRPATAPCSVGKLYAPGKNKYSIIKGSKMYNSFKSQGWAWGGDWNSLKDYMHFSFAGG